MWLQMSAQSGQVQIRVAWPRTWALSALMFLFVVHSLLITYHFIDLSSIPSFFVLF